MTEAERAHPMATPAKAQLAPLLSHTPPPDRVVIGGLLYGYGGVIVAPVPEGAEPVRLQGDGRVSSQVATKLPPPLAGTPP